MTILIIGIIATIAVLAYELISPITRTWVKVTECIVYGIAWLIGCGIWSWREAFLCGAIVALAAYGAIYNRFGDTIFYDYDI